MLASDQAAMRVVIIAVGHVARLPEDLYPAGWPTFRRPLPHDVAGHVTEYEKPALVIPDRPFREIEAGAQSLEEGVIAHHFTKPLVPYLDTQLPPVLCHLSRVLLPQQPANGVRMQSLHHGVLQGYLAMALRLVYDAAFSILTRPSSRRFPPVGTLAPKQQMHAIRVEPYEVLLVLDLVVAHTLGDRVIAIHDVYVERLEWWMELEVAAEHPPVAALPRVGPARVVKGEERAAVLHEFFDRLFLVRLHPGFWLALMAVGPLHAIPMKDQELLAGEAIGIDRREVRRVRYVQPCAFQNRADRAVRQFRIVITVACQKQCVRHIGCIPSCAGLAQTPTCLVAFPARMYHRRLKAARLSLL